MMLNICAELPLPLNTVTSTLVVYGGKGMGKTNFAAVVAEELYKKNLRFSVLDPLGVNWGLQHGRSKDHPGLKIVILGGIHGDIPIVPSAGAVVADFVADESISTVVDISRHANGKMWSFGERIRFVSDYCYRLFERQGERRIPLMQIIDECGRFCPQTIPAGSKDLAMCVGAIEQLVEWGRNVGIGVTLITQRSARMNKSVSELAESMFSFRTIGPHSHAAVMDWLGEHVEKERLKELSQNVRSLPVGSALLVSPGWLDFEGVVSVRKRETFDSSKTPEAGVEPRAPGKASKPDLDKYRSRMVEVEAEARAADPRELRRKIAELEQQLRAGRAQVSVDTAELEKAEKRGYANGEAACRTAVRQLEAEVVDLRNKLSKIHQLSALADQPAPAIHEPAPARPPERRKVEIRPVRQERPRTSDNSTITGPEQRILNAIRWFEELGNKTPKRVAVAFMARYSVDGGSFKNPCGSLRAKGLIDYVGDCMKLTDSGRDLAVTPDQGLTTRDLHDAVYSVLPGPERKILEVVINEWPKEISFEECADRSGYAVEGGSFKNPRGRLRSLGLIDYPSSGWMRAEDLLFPTGK